MPRQPTSFTRTAVAAAIVRWMSGLLLTDVEISIVEAVLQFNAADQFVRCNEGMSS
jgi:hypothetical protein